MYAFQYLLTLAGLWVSAFAGPNPLLSAVKGKRTFSFQQQPVPRTSPWRGPMSMQRAYLKYGMEVPDYISTAAESQPPSGRTSIGVRPVKGDVEYLITATVGNHTLSLNLDTGSSDLWVFSTLQPAEQWSNRPIKRVYNPEDSNAKQLNGHSWQIRYGDMSGANGRVYIEKISIGDLTVQEQAIGAATSVTENFIRDTVNDGLLGLAFSQLNTIIPKVQSTWFENVRPQLAEPLFTCALKRRAVGTYDFGYIDKGKYTGDIIWTPIKGVKGFWDLETTAFKVGDGPVMEFNVSAVVDTAASLWLMPKEVTDAYWEKVEDASYSQAQAGWVFPCRNILPDISLKIADGMITVPGINMNYQQISITTCFGGLQRNDHMPFSIFGDIFLKGLFVIFEAKNDSVPRLGFAHQSRP